MTQYTIYTRPGCKYCNRAKILLASREIDYIEVIVGQDIDRDNLIAKFPTSKTLPIVENDGRLIGGYEDLIDHLNPPLE